MRSTNLNRLKKATAEDPAKLDNEIQKPNLQRSMWRRCPLMPTPCGSASPCACWKPGTAFRL